MAMRQVAFHMLKNANRFYKYYEEQLLRAGESYESYVVNIFHSNVWGDDLIAGAFGDMWNIAVSVISPIAKKPFHLWHNKSVPDVVLVCNGGNYLTAGGSTHYSGTRSTDVHFKKPGSDTMNPTLKQDLTGILMPVLLKRKDFAKQKALDEYVKDEKQATLDMLRTVSKGIRRIDDRIAMLVHESDEFIKKKKFLEFKMEKLGIHTEQIQEYTDAMMDRPWCRTAEREMEDEEEANRKRQLEEQREESEAKKQRIMPTVEGHANPDFLSPSKRSEDSEHDELLKKQQQEILRGHELTIQKQEQALFAQERTIQSQRELIEKLQEQLIEYHIHSKQCLELKKWIVPQLNIVTIRTYIESCTTRTVLHRNSVQTRWYSDNRQNVETRIDAFFTSTTTTISTCCSNQCSRG